MEKSATTLSDVGTRVRNRRIEQNMKQADLASAVGISASYLNLIEHNRRRIADALLERLAEALQVTADDLSADVDRALLDRMLTAASHQTHQPEVDRAADLALRFPGWAGVISAQASRIAQLEARVQEMADRMTYDPSLAASLHQVISAATSIRSTASILTGEEDVDADWQKRFHNNIHADALRLTESSDALITYLETPEEGETPQSPLQDAEDFLADREFHLPELEAKKGSVRSYLSAQDLSSAAVEVLTPVLERYKEDALLMPMEVFEDQARAADYDPFVMVRELNVDLAAILRRLSALPGRRGHPSLGLLRCDASGSLGISKHLPGVVIPRSGACPFWPIYEALGQPGRPVRRICVLPGTPQLRVLCVAIAHQTVTSPGEAPRMQATMSLLPDPAPEPGTVQLLGPSCRICSRHDCDGRREPSVLQGL